MVDTPDTLERHRLPLNRGQLAQAATLARPALMFARRNPFILIGAAVVGVAGMMAWRNRDKIAARAQPLIDDAKLKGQAMIEDAKLRGEELIEQAKSAGEAVAAKATRSRRSAAAETTTPEIH
jgi:hypothetical protein